MLHESHEIENVEIFLKNISTDWTFMIIQKYVLYEIKTVLQIQLSHFSFQYNNQFPQQIIRCLYLQFQYALYVEIKDHL